MVSLRLHLTTGLNGHDMSFLNITADKHSFWDLSSRSISITATALLYWISYISGNWLSRSALFHRPVTLCRPRRLPLPRGHINQSQICMCRMITWYGSGEWEISRWDFRQWVADLLSVMGIYTVQFILIELYLHFNQWERLLYCRM